MPPGLRIRRQAKTDHPPPQRTVTSGPVHCRIPTRIGRATGKSDRYLLSAVRALPLRARRGRRVPNDPAARHNVVLQASDGHLAVCVFTQGNLSTPTLVPGEALPTRYADGRSRVDLDPQGWRSNDGQQAPAIEPDAQFPAVGDVLPDLSPIEPANPARNGSDPNESGSPAVAVAISIERLKRIAMGLGTDSVTLLIPQPRAQPGKHRSELTVAQPIGVCPAGANDVDGIAVMMPEATGRGIGYYRQLREAVCRSEQAIRRNTSTRKEVHS